MSEASIYEDYPDASSLGDSQVDIARRIEGCAALEGCRLSIDASGNDITARPLLAALVELFMAEMFPVDGWSLLREDIANDEHRRIMRDQRIGEACDAVTAVAKRYLEESRDADS